MQQSNGYIQYQKDFNANIPVAGNGSHKQRQKKQTRIESKPSHDAIFGGIRKRNETIVLMLMHNEGEVKGKVTQFDKYTVSIISDNGQRSTWYKHAIAGFTVEQ